MQLSADSTDDKPDNHEDGQRLWWLCGRWWSTWSGVLQGTTAVWTSTAHSMKKMWTTAPTTLDPSRMLML